MGDNRPVLRPAILLTAAAVVLTACGGSGEATAPEPSATTMADQPDNPVVVENQQEGDPTWRKAIAHADDPEQLSAYADRSSVTPGDPVGLHVSTTAAKYTVTAYRMGWYDGARARKVWTSPEQPGTRQTEQGFLEATRTPYAKWNQSLQVDTADWVPGMYLFRLTAANGAEWLVPLVVRSPDAEGRLVFIMSDLTWQAYNEWGSRSAYLSEEGGFEDRSRAVSFSRPYANGYGTGKYLAYEQPVVALAEKLGVPVSYVAASDLSDGSDELLRGAEGVVSLGHNEYWTQGERAAVTRARDAGTDLGFLGANTMYWRVRWQPDGPEGLPLQVIYKSADEDPDETRDTTARFRDPPDPRPERALVGMDYECYPATGTYTIATPNFFLFDGTDTSRTYAGLVDVEVDRAYPLPGTPRTLQVVANSPTTCSAAATVSNSTYYTVPSGAGVFAVGTMGWVLRALRRDAPKPTTRFAEKVSSNLLLAMMRGPMGQEHPSEPNLKSFDLSPVNTTGAA